MVLYFEDSLADIILISKDLKGQVTNQILIYGNEYLLGMSSILFFSSFNNHTFLIGLYSIIFQSKEK